MTDDTSPSKPRRRSARTRSRTGGGSAKAKRKAARLAAVQALYQLDVNDTPINAKTVEALLIEFIEHRLGQEVDEGEGEKFIAADQQLFADIVRGACRRRADVDALVSGALDPRHALDRLEAPLRAILRAGASELSGNPAAHSRIIISEYLDVAHAFYAGREPGMVNAVLDKAAKAARPHEGDEQAPGREAASGDDDGDDDA